MDNHDSKAYSENTSDRPTYNVPQLELRAEESKYDSAPEYDLMYDAPIGLVNRLKPLRQDYTFTFRLMFSRKPMRSFNLELNALSLLLLAILNLLFGSLALGATLKRIVSVYYTNLTGAVMPQGGKVFFKLWGYSALMQLASVSILLLLMFLLAVALGSKRRPLPRFVQTIEMATVPQTILTVAAFLLSLIHTNIGIAMLIVAQIIFYIYLYAGFQKSHPTRHTSPFWLFPIVCGLEVLVSWEIFLMALKAL